MTNEIPEFDACLIDDIVQAWRQLPAPSAYDLRGLEGEMGVEVSMLFAGKKADEIDRDADEFEESFALLYMPPAAAATALGAFMLSALEKIQLHKNNEFVLDHSLLAHVFGCLNDKSFVQSVIKENLPACHQRLVASFIDRCNQERDALAIRERDYEALNAIAADLRGGK